jgi:hypothetical protein
LHTYYLGNIDHDVLRKRLSPQSTIDFLDSSPHGPSVHIHPEQANSPTFWHQLTSSISIVGNLSD